MEHEISADKLAKFKSSLSSISSKHLLLFYAQDLLPLFERAGAAKAWVANSWLEKYCKSRGRVAWIMAGNSKRVLQTQKDCDDLTIPWA